MNTYFVILNTNLHFLFQEWAKYKKQKYNLSEEEYLTNEGRKILSNQKNCLRNALKKANNVEKVQYMYDPGFKYYCITDSQQGNNIGIYFALFCRAEVM